MRRDSQVCLNSEFSTSKLQLTSYKQGRYFGSCSLSIAVSMSSCEMLATADRYLRHVLRFRTSEPNVLSRTEHRGSCIHGGSLPRLLFEWFLSIFIQHIMISNMREMNRRDRFLMHFLANLKSFDISKQRQKTIAVRLMVKVRHRFNLLRFRLTTTENLSGIVHATVVNKLRKPMQAFVFYW